jgi:hypothetical protein
MQHLTISLDGIDGARLLHDWQWLLSGSHRLLAITRMGDAFVEKADGEVIFLDTLERALKHAATNQNAFFKLLKAGELDPTWFIPNMVALLEAQSEHLAPDLASAIATRFRQSLAARSKRQTSRSSAPWCTSASWANFTSRPDICRQAPRSVSSKSLSRTPQLTAVPPSIVRLHGPLLLQCTSLFLALDGHQRWHDLRVRNVRVI